MKRRLSSYKYGKLLIWFLKNPSYLARLFIALPAIGLVVDLFWYCSAFQRSGAVLVVFAIASIYVSYLVSSERSHAEKIELMTNSVDPSIQDSEKRKMLADFLQKAGESAGQMREFMDETKEKLSFYEFTAGVCGTLIWAFGDLLPCASVSCGLA